MKTFAPRSRNAAFTLIELLVVIGIIAILAGMLLPALSHANSRAQSSACLNNQKQLQLSWDLYTDDHNEVMPPNIMQSGSVWRSLPGSWVLGNGRIDLAVSNIESGVLYSYAQSRQLYRCPANRVLGGAPPANRQPLIRTYAIECRLNSGSLSNQTNRAWMTVRILSSTMTRAAGGTFRKTCTQRDPT